MPSKTTLFIKRVFDCCASFIAIILFSPLLLITGIAVAATSKGSVFFAQVRVGKTGVQFKILKFRTMVQNAEKIGKQITVGNDTRVTEIGKVLRASKIDELPQLFNIFIGHMSFVGPRPEVPRYVDMYNAEQREVLNVKPGLTDYASIEYRSESEVLAKSPDPEYTYIHEIMPHKLSLNRKYIEEMSLYTDIKILFKTFLAVLHLGEI